MAKKKKEIIEEEPAEFIRKEPAGYEVVKRLWIRNVERYPGYILDAQDLGAKGTEGIKHLLDLGAIKEI